GWRVSRGHHARALSEGRPVQRMESGCLETAVREGRAHALGDGGSRVVGAARIGRYSMRPPRYGKGAWKATASFPRGSGRLLRRDRVGGDASVEQREGRGHGDLVLRHERVARRGPATTAPGGDRAVGRSGRPLPRRKSP